MIIPGRIAVARKVVTNLISIKHQTQPCGVDLTLKRVLQWSSNGTVDFDNALRKTATTNEIPFRSGLTNLSSKTTSDNSATRATNGTNNDDNSMAHHLTLAHGSYLVEFNELVDMPLDLMGQIFVRSSLFRSGALISAGVMDSGYKGPVGAMLQVVNPHGLRLMRNAKLAQIVFHEMSESVDGYDGVYQGRAFGS
ncbi:putative dUTPase [Aaosphaeria arxii CBS 175.79]|uniref:Putative dUTPase n=1 Tax=Aaosphaeria arxii CBS 175.79 TaxID=1450172 RepID=A0A6A5XMH3_9PLEO|nr:putative dUTPase [Aaosphaeria arxii CBS 175.79]KAF2014011.1 putative dUTPase [Aaosphaeria arxii CBS 175.79]